jgi:hypothetical protein
MEVHPSMSIQKVYFCTVVRENVGGPVAGRRSSSHGSETQWKRPRGNVLIRRRQHSRNQEANGEERRGEEVMGYKNLEQQQQAVEAAQYENSKKQTRIQVYQKYLRVFPCDANDKFISEICDRWLGGNSDVLHSLAVFEEAIAENPTEFDALAKQLEAKTCEQLIDQIVGTLVAHGKGHDDFTLRSERTRLSTFSIPMLRARLADLQTKARMAGTSVRQLKQMVADARPVPGFPTLLRQLFENGATVQVNAAYLKALDTYSLKRMCRIYSTEAVNSRLAEG